MSKREIVRGRGRVRARTRARQLSSLKPFLPCTALISFSCQRAMQTACTDWRPAEFFPYSQGAHRVPASYHLPSTLRLPPLLHPLLPSPFWLPSYLVPLWKPVECFELCLQCRKVACAAEDAPSPYPGTLLPPPPPLKLL